MKKLSIALLLSAFIAAPLAAVVSNTIGGEPTEATTGSTGVIAEGLPLTPTPETDGTDAQTQPVMATLQPGRTKPNPQDVYSRYTAGFPRLQARIASAASNPAELARLEARLAQLQAKWGPRIAEWKKKGILPADDTPAMATLTAAEPVSDATATDTTATASMADTTPAYPNA